MTPDEYRQRWGVEPRQDDLDRVGCAEAGQSGHMLCGVCEHGLPRFACRECLTAIARVIPYGER